jgi:hypothetical protein
MMSVSSGVLGQLGAAAPERFSLKAASLEYRSSVDEIRPMSTEKGEADQ